MQEKWIYVAKDMKDREIGGYIELDTYSNPMLHEDATALNCGRNGLAYLIKSRKIKKIKLPLFLCTSISDVCDREGVEKSYYHVKRDLRPDKNIQLDDDEWLFLVNYYDQLSNYELKKYVERFERVIIDQANGYFEKPLKNVDTIYTCRKWFGVADGAFLYTDSKLDKEIVQDESYDRMKFLLGRYEKGANEFFAEYQKNNLYFAEEPIKKISKLTYNLLHGIDYSKVEKQRRENFEYLHERLKNINQLTLRTGSFMYPFMIDNGASIRRALQKQKIYIPTLWPSVFEMTCAEDDEYYMAENILPLPIDQRYSIEDMEYMVNKIKECIRGKGNGYK